MIFIGCIDAIEPHLPTLIPYLINMLNDPKVNCSGIIWALIFILMVTVVL